MLITYGSKRESKNKIYEKFKDVQAMNYFCTIKVRIRNKANQQIICLTFFLPQTASLLSSELLSASKWDTLNMIPEQKVNV